MSALSRVKKRTRPHGASTKEGKAAWVTRNLIQMKPMPTLEEKPLKNSLKET